MGAPDESRPGERDALAIHALPGNHQLATRIARSLGARVTPVQVDVFPDGEPRVTVERGPATQGPAILVASLHHPTDRILPLLFAAGALRERGCAPIGLVAPYLAFMRQDREFHPGEVVSATQFARLLSHAVDWLVTAEPHLHRIDSLQSIYTIPATAVHVAADIAAWIARRVSDGIVIGPDAESRQWARAVANDADLPFEILAKTRVSSEHVEVRLPDMDRWRNRRPILIDDVIATGHTMREAARRLYAAGFPPPVCIAVHGLFVGNAYSALLAAGVDRIVTTNTIPHPSNEIDVAARLVAAIEPLLSAVL